ncbi:MAG: C40 family peptidase [Oscillospiraceae bacterium]|nr:C40 family peptidase [Oscillospiraceae bacterium]
MLSSLKKLLTASALLFIVLFAISANSLAAEAQMGQVKASSLRFRAAPSLSGKEMGRISNGATILILDSVENGEWYKVVHNYQIGYVSAEYVKLIGDADMDIGDGVINGTNVNVRGEPSLNANIQTKLNTSDRVNIIGVSAGWFKVSRDGTVGYIHADYLNVERPARVMEQPVQVDMIDDDVEPELMDGDGDYADDGEANIYIEDVAVPTGALTDIQTEIVNFAKSYLGKKYKYGTSGPNTFDCSGFTTYVYKNFGYSLNRSSAGQLNNGVTISKAELQVGDLVLFRDPSINKAAASHVGIFIGDDKFIHASSRRGGVIITSMSENYYTRYFVGARRIL